MSGIGGEVYMASWHITRLDEKYSVDAGLLVKRILRDEFGVAATVCADGDLEDMFAAYSAPGCAAWVALGANEDIIGVAAVMEKPTGALELRRFYLDPIARGSGLATDMITLAHEWAEAESYQRMLLTTTGFMDRAQSFYRKHG